MCVCVRACVRARVCVCVRVCACVCMGLSISHSHLKQDNNDMFVGTEAP